MSSDPTPRIPSWKNQRGGTPNRPQTPWRNGAKSPAKPEEPKAPSRFGRRLAAGLFVSGLVALLVIVILFWLPPKPPRLVLVAPGSPTNLALPANVYGANVLRDFAGWAKEDANRAQLAQEPAEGTTAEDWHAALTAGREKTVVLFFAAHGAADRSGPYLWLVPPDAPAPQEKHRLRLTDVLHRLAELPSRKNKVLILDVTQLGASWAHGMFHNDFARALKGLDAEIEKVPNLVVLCASDEDQRSWASEEWRQSVFGHFWLEGLKGAAAGSDPKLTVWNLFQYAQKEVGTWARANRDAEQAPILLPLKGGRERAEKIELVRAPAGDYQPPAAAAAPGNDFRAPPELLRAWQRRDELAATEPPPESAAPHVWREYLDTLLRCEQLHRTGVPIDSVLRRLEALDRELSTPPWLPELPCLTNALPVGRLLGAPAGTKVDAARFRQLWDLDEPAAREARWKALQKEFVKPGDEAAATLLRLQAAEWLLNRLDQRDDASKPTPEVLARAADFLRVVDGAAVRPVETHTVLMLQRDLAATRPEPELLQRALRVRRLAEEVALLGGGAKPGAHPYSEQVFRWVRVPLREADDLRRMGEDLLFPDNREFYEKKDRGADDYLAKAEARYREAAADARAVGEALRARDRVLSRLPYYARWLAGYRGTLPAVEQERLMAKVEQLGTGTHKLAALLDDVPADPAPKLAELKPLAAQVTRDFEEVARAFDEDAARLGGAVLPSNWHALDNTLSVPFLPAARRVKLLQDLRDVSRQLHAGNQVQNAPAAGATPQAAARDLAMRQGRMALAVLGERWVADPEGLAGAPTGVVPLRYGELLQRVTQPKVGAWWESVQEAADQVGWHWRALARGTESAAARAGKDELDAAAKSFARAVYLSRLLDSATALPGAVRPCADERRLWMHHLLLAQARRTTEDRWAAFDPEATRPYCEEAGERYVLAAERLMLGSDPNLDSREQARRLAAAKPVRASLPLKPFALKWPKVKDLTDERSFAIGYTVEPPPGLPPGYPLFAVSKLAAPLKLADPTVASRQPVLDFAERSPPAASYTRPLALTRGEPKDREKEAPPSAVEMTLLHRGHRLMMKTDVRLNKPNVEWVRTPPAPNAKAAFAVLADEDVRTGAVAILFDKTYSMNSKIEGGSTKFAAATNALEDVLRALPRGTRLSLAFFDAPDRSGVVRLKPVTEDGPIEWDGTRGQRDAIMKRVRDTTADGEWTPLALTIKEVLRKRSGEFFPKQFTGFRTLVVLTDGDDTVIDDQKQPATKRPGEVVVETLEARPDVALHMILFGLSKTEEVRARTQFAAVEEPDSFRESHRIPAKIWYSVRTSGQLGNALRESMLPRVQVLREGALLDRESPGLPVTLRTENFWGRPQICDPGTYQLRVPGMRRPKTLHLEPADRVLLELRRFGDELDLNVAPFTEGVPDLPASLTKLDGDKLVRLTVGRNAMVDRGGPYDLDLRVAFERNRLRTEELRLVRPEFAWFEVRPENADPDPKRYRLLRVESLLRRTAPAWQVELKPWFPVAGQDNVRTNPARPRLDAWWVDRLPGDGAPLPIPSLNLLKRDPAKFAGDLTVGGTTVTVDEVAVEDGELVVRLTHEPGKPVVVRLTQLREGELRYRVKELHRFYDRANKYTVRFGPIDESDRARPFTLELYSLESLKRVANPVRMNLEEPTADGRDWLQAILPDLRP